MEKCDTGSLNKFQNQEMLRDGTRVRIRPMRSGDEDKLLAFFRALSDESKWRRFFSPVKDFTLINEAKRESEVDCDHRFGLLATVSVAGNTNDEKGDDEAGDENERVVGHALYFRLNETHADAAFTVADEFQGRGLGTLLLLRLAEFATTRGIRFFEADVMPDNQPMIDVFRHSGFKVTSKIETGVVHIEFPIDERSRTNRAA